MEEYVVLTFLLRIASLPTMEVAGTLCWYQVRILIIKKGSCGIRTISFTTPYANNDA